MLKHTKIVATISDQRCDVEYLQQNRDLFLHSDIVLLQMQTGRHARLSGMAATLQKCRAKKDWPRATGFLQPRAVSVSPRPIPYRAFSV